MKDELTKVNNEVEELRLIVNKLAINLKPRRYVQNRKTLVTHRIAMGFEEVGLRARTLCGWKYAGANVDIMADPPRLNKQTCDTCLPALRATLALRR